ncbi:MAG: M20/M25/M40 family metallo-hydrolase [Chitinispirillales bacterium]|jgi:di/tripeptidase|nr:M20/M25/M40 family metallo-hydrolase [Chitinispirillales bacterium]
MKKTQGNEDRQLALPAILRYAPYAVLFTFISLCLCGNPVKEAERPVAKTVYEYFVDLSKYPRCSGSERPASDFLVAFGRAHGLDTRRDEALNVLIKKGGSLGRENEPPIILQAHIDMVCRKDDDVEHDFGRDPIIPVINDDWITAQKRTTLGADGGGGVSMIMAVLAASGLSHPPIEAVFTTEEEFGLLGAERFDVSWLSGGRLLNLDMVREGAIVVGDGHVDGPDVVVPIAATAQMKAAVIPEWPYNPDSPLRDKMVDVFREYYGYEPMIAGLQHAAVECSMFGSKMPDADMASIGPDIIDNHTPDERMSFSSYNRVYGYLVILLERL